MCTLYVAYFQNLRSHCFGSISSLMPNILCVSSVKMLTRLNLLRKQTKAGKWSNGMEPFHNRALQSGISLLLVSEKMCLVGLKLSFEIDSSRDAVWKPCSKCPTCCYFLVIPALSPLSVPV